ncbi:unnamed protein product, partial [marine sediment metagenome]
SQAVYTVILDSKTSDVPPDFTKGISSTITPTNSTLTNDTTYTFQYVLDSSNHTISSFGFVLFNSTDDSVGSDSDTTDGGTVSVVKDVGNDSRIVMRYYYVIESNYTNSTRTWSILGSGGIETNLDNFFVDFKAYLLSGIFGLTEFGAVVLI